MTSKGFFKDLEGSIDVDVIEGKPYQKLLQWIDNKEVDLVVVGYKEKSEGSGITAKRLARHTTANVLFVSDQSTTEINTVVVPVDFSEHSAKAIKHAIDLKATFNNDLTIHAVHIVDLLPMGHYYGLNLNYQYLEALVKNAKIQFDEFLVKNQINSKELEVNVMSNEHNNIAQHLSTYIRGVAPELVIMGAQGHSLFERFLYGSITEQLLNEELSSSIMIVR